MDVICNNETLFRNSCTFYNFIRRLQNFSQFVLKSIEKIHQTVSDELITPP